MQGGSGVISANEYQRVRWHNGLGWTREIVREPDHAAWDWRLSIAEIERESEFSQLPGVERELVLLHGNGLRLAAPGRRTLTLSPPFGRHRIAGEHGLRGEPLDGPVHAFTLMWRRGCVEAQLLLRPLVGPMLFFSQPGEVWALHMVGGEGRFDRDSGLPPLWQGDTALLVGDGRRRRHMLEGGGQLLAIRITPIDAAAPAAGQ